MAGTSFITSLTKRNNIITETDPLKAAEELMRRTIQKLANIYQDSEKEKLLIERTIIGNIGTELQQAYMEITKALEAKVKPKNDTSAIDRMESMEKNIKVIMETVTTMNPRTYAQVIATTNQATAPNIHLKMTKRERLEKAKEELAKTEIILNFRNATNDMKKKGYKLGGFG